MAEQTFEMTATRLATVTKNTVARRERQIARRLIEIGERIAEQTGSDGIVAELARYAGELAGSMPTVVIPSPGEPEPIEPEDETIVDDAPGLPPVRHTDDFADGVALARMSPVRRGVQGYNGATGKLRG